MLNRKFAAAALALGVMFGTAGCNFISPIATMEVYTPSDGSDANFGQVAARNIFILVNPAGQTALFGSFVNKEDAATSFSFDLAGQSYSLSLAGNEKLDIGFNGSNAVALGGFSAQAGSLADVTFKNGSETVEQTVPVLDATFAQFAPLVNSMNVIAPTEAPE